MPVPQTDRNPVEVLAEEFVERQRRGERPSIEEYTEKYPELADDIREVFPALMVMENLKPRTGEMTGAIHQAAASAPDPSRGRTLERLGDYRILREIGRGGMGIVYEAEQESLGRHVALKVLPSQALLDPKHLARFQREARAAARLHHTNIVPVYGVGYDEGLHYYVMQFIHGQGLDEVLDEIRRIRRQRLESKPQSGKATPPPGDRRPPAVAVANAMITGTYVWDGDSASLQDRPVYDPLKTEISVAGSDGSPLASSADPERPARWDAAPVRLPGQADSETTRDTGRTYWHSIARIGVQVAEALHYANSQGTLHRDIKPSNLLLDTQGTVWITDFGLAKAASEQSDISHTGDIVGTLRYMAPERFSGRGDIRSDIYSLGLTLYELATLEAAFSEQDRNKLVQQVLHEEPLAPRKRNSDIPRDLETIILKAISRDPSHRYSTGKALADDLRNFIEDKPIKARRITYRERLVRWCRRNPALASSIAASVLIFLVGFALVAWMWREESQARADADLARADAEARRIDADLARRDAEAKAEEIRVGVERLNQANALVESSRIHAHYQRWADAEKDLTRATELRPDNSLLWIERSRLYLTLGLWDLALADVNTAWNLQEPEPGVAWYHEALLRASQNDLDGYRARSKTIAELLQELDDPTTASELAHAGALLPGGQELTQQLVKAAEKGLASPTDRASRLYVLALAHYRAGNLAEAVQRAREAINTGAAAPAVHFLQAMALARQGPDKKEEATLAFERGQSQLGYWLDMGVTGSFQASATWSIPLEGVLLQREAALALDGAVPESDVRAVLRRARALTLLQRFDDAGAEYRRAVELFPKDPQVHLAVFRFHAERRDWPASDKALDEACALKPGDSNIRMEAFRVFLDKGDWDRAVEQVDKAVEAAMGDAKRWLRVQAFYSLADKGQWDHAIAQIDKSAEGLPGILPVQLEGVRYLLSRGDVPAAKKEYERVRKLKPNQHALIHQGANLFFQYREYAFAAGEFQRYIEVAPPDGPINSQWYFKAECHVHLGQWMEAIDAYTKMLEKRPYWTGYQHRGDAYAERGDWEQAIADFKKTVELTEKMEVNIQLAARTRLALAYLAAGRTEDYQMTGDEILKLGGEARFLDRGTAIAALNALTLTPEYPTKENFKSLQDFLAQAFERPRPQLYELDPAVRAARSRVLYRNGLSFTQPMRGLEFALKQNPQLDPADQLFLAMAYHRTRRPADAERTLEQALKQIDRFGPPAAGRPNEFQKRWHERLPHDLLKKEAVKLIKGG